MDDDKQWIMRLQEKLTQMQQERDELLTALQDAADHLYNPFEPDNQGNTYKRVRAAIAKATTV